MEAYQKQQWQLADKLAALTLTQIESSEWKDWVYRGERKPFLPYLISDYVVLATSDNDQRVRLNKLQIYDPSKDELVRVHDFTPWNIVNYTCSKNFVVNYVERVGYLGYKMVWFEKDRPEIERSITRDGIEHLEHLAKAQKTETDFIDLLEKGPRGWGLSIFDILAGSIREVHIFEKKGVVRKDVRDQFKSIKDSHYWKFIDGNKLYSLTVGNWNKKLLYMLPFEVAAHDVFSNRFEEKLTAVRNDTLYILRHRNAHEYDLRTIRLPFPLEINHWSKKIDDDNSGKWFAQSDSDSLRIFRLGGDSAQLAVSTTSCVGGTFALTTNTFWKGDTLIHYGNSGLKIFKGSDPIYSIDAEEMWIDYNDNLEVLLIYRGPGEFSVVSITDLKTLWTEQYPVLHAQICDLLKEEYLLINHLDGTSLLDAKTGEELLRIHEVAATQNREINEDKTKILLGGENFLGVYEISNKQKLKSDLIAISAASKWAAHDTLGALQAAREAIARGSNLSGNLPESMLNILHSLDLKKESIRFIGNMAIRTGEYNWEKKLKDEGTEFLTQPYLADIAAFCAMDKGIFTFPVLIYPFSIASGEERKCYWLQKPDYQAKKVMLPVSGITIAKDIIIFYEYKKSGTGETLIWNPLQLTESGELRNLGRLFETKREQTNLDNQYYADYVIDPLFSPLSKDRVITNIAIQKAAIGGWEESIWRDVFTVGIDLTGEGNNWYDSTTVFPVRIGNRYYAHKRYGDFITEVYSGSQADSIGIKDGDAVLSFGGYTLSNTVNVAKIKTYYPDRSPLELTILREGDTLQFTVLNGTIGYDLRNCFNLVEIDPETGTHLREIGLPPGYEIKAANTSNQLVYTSIDTLLFFDPESFIEKKVYIEGIEEYWSMWDVPNEDILLMHRGGVGEILALDISKTADDEERVLWKQTFEDIYRIFNVPRYCLTDDRKTFPILLDDGTLLVIDAATGSVLSRETTAFQNFGYLPQILDGTLYGDVASKIFGWNVAYYHPPFPWKHMGFGASALIPLLFIGIWVHRSRVDRLKQKQAVELKRAETDAQISAARRLQASLIPTGSHKLGKFHLVGKFIPASEVAGDYFDFRLLDDGRLVVVMGDVSGHGLSAGILVSMAKASLMTFHRSRGADFEETLASLNEVIRNGSPDKEMFMTICYLILDPRTKKISCSANGHPFPLIARGDGTVTEIGANGGYPLGVRDEQQYEIVEADFQPGDTVLVYTDGLPEQLNVEGEPWGYENLTDAFRDFARAKEAESVVNGLLEKALQYTDAVREDDMALVAIRYNP